MPLLNTLNGPIIAMGQHTSGVLDLGTDYIVGMIMPEEWTPAVVSVLVSPDGDNFFDLHDFHGGPVMFNVEPGTIVAIDPHWLMMARYLQLRSGTADDPVPQAKTRNFRTIGTMQLTTLTNDPTRR